METFVLYTLLLVQFRYHHKDYVFDHPNLQANPQHIPAELVLLSALSIVSYAVYITEYYTAITKNGYHLKDVGGGYKTSLRNNRH